MKRFEEFFKKYKTAIYIVIGIVLLFFAVKPLFSPGFFPIHDNEQIARLFEVDQDAKAMHIPPRLTQDLGFGYDYPLFNFYPPLVYYIADAIHIFGFSYIVSMKIMLVIGFMLAFLGMYLFSKMYIGRLGGVTAAIAYSFAPYHAIDIYVRGAFPEFFSFLFVPFLFWSYAKLQKTSSIFYAIVSGIFIALFILAHNLIAMMSSIFLFLFIVYLFMNTQRKKSFAIQTTLSCIVGIGLSAYFSLPAIFEKKYTMVDLLTSELANYNLHFVYLKQFFNSPWGYGGSVFGLNDGLSFQVGKVHLLAFFLVATILLFSYLYKRKNNMFVLLFFVMFVISLFMQTLYSQFIWDHFSPFWYIQFPWRFLLFSSFFGSFLVGLLVWYTKEAKLKLLLAVTIGVAVVSLYKDSFQPQSYLTNAEDKDYTSQEALRWNTSRLSFEYAPKGIQTTISPLGNTIIAIKESEIAKTPYQVLSGNIKVNTLEDKPQEKKFLVSVEKPGKIQFNTYSFPGWKAFVGNQEVFYTDNNKLKLISVSVPQGQHILILKFENTPIRKVGNILSVVTVFSIILYSFYSFTFSKNHG